MTPRLCVCVVSTRLTEYPFVLTLGKGVWLMSAWKTLAKKQQQWSDSNTKIIGAACNGEILFIRVDSSINMLQVIAKCRETMTTMKKRFNGHDHWNKSPFILEMPHANTTAMWYGPFAEKFHSEQFGGVGSWGGVGVVVGVGLRLRHSGQDQINFTAHLMVPKPARSYYTRFQTRSFKHKCSVLKITAHYFLCL